LGYFKLVLARTAACSASGVALVLHWRSCPLIILISGEPAGVSFKVANYEAYLATPSSPEKAHPKTAILYVPDVLGIWNNSKLIADHFAERGYLCLIIDVLNGDPLVLNSFLGLDLSDWLNNGSNGKNPHTPEHVDPIMLAAIEYLKTEKGVEKIGAVGYCFGARVRAPIPQPFPPCLGPSCNAIHPTQLLCISDRNQNHKRDPNF
jgi:hypothetical protein